MNLKRGLLRKRILLQIEIIRNMAESVEYESYTKTNRQEADRESKSDKRKKLVERLRRKRERANLKLPLRFVKVELVPQHGHIDVCARALVVTNDRYYETSY